MGTLSSRYYFFLLEGLFLSILGLICLILPVLGAYSFEFMMGAVFLLSGMAQGFRVAFTREAPAQNFTLLSSLLLVIFGLALWIFPWLGIMTATLIISILFFIDGTLKLLSAFQYRFFSKWGWYILGSIFEILIALMIWNAWPVSAVWFIGVLIGINFFSLGLTHMAFALELRNKGKTE